MRLLLTTILGLAFALHACAPTNPIFTTPPAPAPAAQSSFNAKMLQHVAALNAKHKHGHGAAIGYIFSHAHRARRVEAAFGIPAEIVLAVAILESDKGGSNIAICAANHFGIKRGDGWDGPTFTCGRGKAWRAYSSVEASYMDFGRYITERAPRFVNSPTPEAFAQTGYAGRGKSKVYAALLRSIIERYELRELFNQN